MRERRHWLVVFGRDAVHLVDEVDRALATWPSYPTALFPVVMTIIPKKVPQATVLAALEVVTGSLPPHTDEQDIFILSNEKAEIATILLVLRSMAVRRPLPPE